MSAMPATPLPSGNTMFVSGVGNHSVASKLMN
jgi:hypothetical protein